MTRFLLFPALIIAISALNCYDSRAKNTCEGDYRYVIPGRMVNSHGDYLTVLTERKCIACEQTASENGWWTRGCRDDTIKTIDRLMRPQSCIRIEMSKYGSDVKCLCDTEDHCDRKLISEQVLDTGSVNCTMRSISSEEDLTCKGQFCFITSESEKGCITNNETLYAGLYRPGTFTFDGIEYVICNTGNCNQNFEEALEYAAAAAVYVPSPILSLTSSATQALSISLYLILIYIFALLPNE